MNYAANKELVQIEGLLRIRKIREAEVALREFLQKNKNEAHAYYLMSQIKMTQNKFKEALSYLKKTLSISPSHKEAGLSLSVLFNDLGLYQESESVFKMLESQRKKQEARDATVEVGFSEKKEHNFFAQENLIEKLQEKIKETPRDYELRMRLGELYYEAGQEIQAVREWSKILSEKPLHASALEKLRAHRSKIRSKLQTQRELI